MEELKKKKLYARKSTALNALEYSRNSQIARKSTAKDAVRIIMETRRLNREGAKNGSNDSANRVIQQVINESKTRDALKSVPWPKPDSQQRPVEKMTENEVARRHQIVAPGLSLPILDSELTNIVKPKRIYRRRATSTAVIRPKILDEPKVNFDVEKSVQSIPSVAAPAGTLIVKLPIKRTYEKQPKMKPSNGASILPIVEPQVQKDTAGQPMEKIRKLSEEHSRASIEEKMDRLMKTNPWPAAAADKGSNGIATLKEADKPVTNGTSNVVADKGSNGIAAPKQADEPATNGTCKAAADKDTCPTCSHRLVIPELVSIGVNTMPIHTRTIGTMAVLKSKPQAAVESLLLGSLKRSFSEHISPVSKTSVGVNTEVQTASVGTNTETDVPSPMVIYGSAISIVVCPCQSNWPIIHVGHKHTCRNPESGGAAPHAVPQSGLEPEMQTSDDSKGDTSAEKATLSIEEVQAAKKPDQEN